MLFASLVFGQVGFTIEPKVLDFLRNFALIIFMYAMGLQVGPGFGASLRAEGVRLNTLTLCVIVLGAAMTAAIARWIPSSMGPGLFSGAFTTTPGLAAAQEAMRGSRSIYDDASAPARTGLAYSITYPFGVVGPMFVVVALRVMFRVCVDDESAALIAAEERSHPHIEIVDLEVTAAEYAGTSLREHPLLKGKDIVFTRLLRGSAMVVPTADTLVQVGDIYRAIGPGGDLSALIAAIGHRSSTNLSCAPGDIQRMDLIVTNTKILHRTLRELDLVHRTGVTIGQIHRAGIELMPTASLRLAFADQVTVAGPQAGIELVEAELGNSVQKLNQSQLIPIFLGIVLGVIVGSIPLVLPGLHGSLRIGLAGGSLLAAIALSRVGSVGSVIWYMPAAANQLFRDFGLAIFLACIGFEAGDHFIQRAAENSGLVLFVWGAVIATLPVFIVACFARVVLRMNFIALSGWVAGAMGSSTTLFFVEEMTASNSPAVAYAAVYRWRS